MSEVKIKDNESLDNALRRFKRQCAKSGILSEVRREHYEKPSVKRKKKLKLQEEIEIDSNYLSRIC